jgi:hypothetical protein
MRNSRREEGRDLLAGAPPKRLILEMIHEQTAKEHEDENGDEQKKAHKHRRQKLHSDVAGTHSKGNEQARRTVLFCFGIRGEEENDSMLTK